MLLLLDTANLEDIQKAVEVYPIDGVTTNPSIIVKEKKDFLPLLKEIQGIIGKDKMLHVQALGTRAEDIVEEAHFIKNQLEGNIYVKIPVIPQGIKAIKILAKEGIQTTATAIFTAQQALMAAKSGAKFVAPYVNRVENISSDGVQVVGEMMKLFTLYGLETKILAASFKNVHQVHRCALEGCHAITANIEIVEKLIYHPLTDMAVEQFTGDWQGQYGKGIRVNDLK
ncbi:fructose-6-phosphate aldolase [Irregularibacter muris]|uniref:Fructose-6-phosphate aldolase n=1 Tax=Irregularibacter muris TaxID=1796619 RepID=A0AAE3HEZ6_9FIRM|nr:fructose-6-phosphate aldolase [Irregularibacter muris]MCR1898280.1 fructose-6-phosphate aldolase [Irregularibacter muris]